MASFDKDGLDLQKLIIVVAVGILLFSTNSAFSQQKQSEENVGVYLQSYLKVNSERPSSLCNRFAEFIPLPSGLQSSLLSAFPKHRFFVAKTLFTHWVPDDGKANILVVTDATSGEVIGHKWAIWFSNGTEPFNHILQEYQAQSPEDAMEKVRVLSKLIVSLSDQETGKIQIKRRTITAELGVSERPWRILKVKIDKRNRFGRMAFINPINGKEM